MDGFEINGNKFFVQFFKFVFGYGVFQDFVLVVVLQNGNIIVLFVFFNFFSQVYMVVEQVEYFFVQFVNFMVQVFQVFKEFYIISCWLVENELFFYFQELCWGNLLCGIVLGVVGIWVYFGYIVIKIEVECFLCYGLQDVLVFIDMVVVIDDRKVREFLFQVDGKLLVWYIVVFGFFVVIEVLVDDFNMGNFCFVDVFNGFYLQFEIWVDGVFDQYGDVYVFQGIGYFLYGKWINSSVGIQLEYINLMFEGFEDVLCVSDFGSYFKFGFFFDFVQLVQAFGIDVFECVGVGLWFLDIGVE